MTKASGKSPIVDIDALLQDSYLLVVELQQKAAPKDGEELWKHCVAQVEQCRSSLIDAGVRAVVQPGGSMRDEEVIAAADAAGITMYFTGERHFFH